jgi:glycosyltransferase involved in cell wall biosynthesis
MAALSIIIPTLNEAENIGPLLGYLRRLDPEAELIVSDADSSDGTAERGRPLARIVLAPPGRGVQMNAGARVASGEVLWFVHADCRPHPDSPRSLRDALSDPALVGGGFTYRLDCEGLR